MPPASFTTDAVAAWEVTVAAAAITEVCRPPLPSDLTEGRVRAPPPPSPEATMAAHPAASPPAGCSEGEGTAAAASASAGPPPLSLPCGRRPSKRVERALERETESD